MSGFTTLLSPVGGGVTTLLVSVDPGVTTGILSSLEESTVLLAESYPSESPQASVNNVKMIRMYFMVGSLFLIGEKNMPD